MRGIWLCFIRGGLLMLDLTDVDGELVDMV